MTSYQEVNVPHNMQGQVILDYDKDVVFTENQQEELHLQILFPVGSDNRTEKKFPCILYMISKTEEREQIHHYIPRLSQFAQRGYVVALMETPTESFNYEEQCILCKKALSFLEEQTSKYHVDTKNMYLWRDGIHEEDINQELINCLAEHSSSRIPVNAMICFGGQEVLRYVHEHISSTIPAALLLPCEKGATMDLEFWTEEVFDIIEDYISNYIN